MKDFDLVVIGAGASGLAAAFAADARGARVALIEKHRIGGENLWTGDVPLKSLLEAARVYDTCKRAVEFGIRIENLRPQWNAVRLRIADVRDDIKKLQNEELAASNIELISGAARFEDGNTLRVTGKSGELLVRAEKFIIATGSKIKLPQIEGLEATGFITPAKIAELPALPRSLAILGDGPTACELAQALARLDCRVTLLAPGNSLLPGEDAEIAAFTAKLLQQEGVTVQLEATVHSVQREGERKRIEVQSASDAEAVVVSEVLLVPGREVDLAEMNLDATGGNWSAAAIRVDKTLKVAPAVWACGGVTGELLSTHAAQAQGKTAARNALSANAEIWDEGNIARAVFTDPEIASVGLTEDAAREKGGDIQIHRREFSKLHRAVIESETRGFLKIVTAADGRVLGAHIAGLNASELIYPFIHAVRDEVLLSELGKITPVYPTMSEIFPSG